MIMMPDGDIYIEDIAGYIEQAIVATRGDEAASMGSHVDAVMDTFEKVRSSNGGNQWSFAGLYGFQGAAGHRPRY